MVPFGIAVFAEQLGAAKALHYCVIGGGKAAEGNRTLVSSLGSLGNTIIRPPHNHSLYHSKGEARNGADLSKS